MITSWISKSSTDLASFITFEDDIERNLFKCVCFRVSNGLVIAGSLHQGLLQFQEEGGVLFSVV